MQNLTENVAGDDEVYMIGRIFGRILFMLRKLLADPGESSVIHTSD